MTKVSEAAAAAPKTKEVATVSRKEMIKAITGSGIKVKRNIITLSNADVATIYRAVNQSKTPTKRELITKYVQDGMTRKEVVAKLEADHKIKTTVGYVNSVAYHCKLVVKDARLKDKAEAAKTEAKPAAKAKTGKAPKAKAKAKTAAKKASPKAKK